MSYEAELTDTFGGEANYSWVRRREFNAPAGASQALIMRRAKAAVGISGLRGVTYSYGDSYEFRPYGECTVLFVQWRDGESEQ